MTILLALAKVQHCRFTKFKPPVIRVMIFLFLEKVFLFPWYFPPDFFGGSANFLMVILNLNGQRLSKDEKYPNS